MINFMAHHRGEICSLHWSTNQSHSLMQTSDPSSVYLASGSNQDHALGVWRLSDLAYGPRSDSPWFFEKEAIESAVKAMAWSPNYEGLLATGGGMGD